MLPAKSRNDTVETSPLQPLASRDGILIRMATRRGSYRRQQPILDAAGRGLTPQDVACAIAVEIAEPGNAPAGRMRAEVDARGPMAVTDFPNLHAVGRGVEPEHVARA